MNEKGRVASRTNPERKLQKIRRETGRKVWTGNHPTRLTSWPFRACRVLAFLSVLISGALTGAEKEKAPLVFLEGEVRDVSFFRAGIPFVTFVEDRAAAHICIFITLEKDEDRSLYVLHFQGQKEFEGDDDRLTHEVRAGAQAEEVDQGLLQKLKMGLLRYAGKMSVAERLSIRFLDQVRPTAVVDPWNFWVFSLSANTFLNGEQTYKSGMYYGSFSANRVTPEWKIRLGVSAMYRKSRFDYEDVVYESDYKSQSARCLLVRSLNDHWSFGGFLSVNSSTYDNIKLSLSPAPAVEFDLFPYSESTKKQLRFLYRLNFKSVRYGEETIFLKTRENLWQQSLSVTLELVRPWGTISTSLETANYLHDFNKNHVELWTDVSLRIFQGFNFNLSGSYSRIHDQLSLARMGASLEEVLLRRRQLATTYDYYFSIGLSYSFGSVRSQVVNPRFGDGGGGVSMRISM
ncbi:MAG: hypothetical protein ACUVV5_06765 [Candidatus Aminicenantales bacterium]